MSQSEFPKMNRKIKVKNNVYCLLLFIFQSISLTSQISHELNPKSYVNTQIYNSIVKSIKENIDYNGN